MGPEVQESTNNVQKQQAYENYQIQNEQEALVKYQKNKLWCADCCLISNQEDKYYFLKGLLCLKSKLFNQVLSSQLKGETQKSNVLIYQQIDDEYLNIELDESSDTIFLLLELLFRAPTNQNLLLKESAFRVTQLAAKYELEEVLADCYKYVAEHISRWELLQTVQDGQADMIDWFLLSKELKWQRVYDQCFRRIVRNLSALQGRANFDRISKEERLTLFQQAYRLEHEKTEDQKKPVKPLKFPDDMSQTPPGPLSANLQNGPVHAHKTLNLNPVFSLSQNSARTPRTQSKITPRTNQNLGRTPRGGLQSIVTTPQEQPIGNRQNSARQNSARSQYQATEQNGFEQNQNHTNTQHSSLPNADEPANHPFVRKSSANGAVYSGVEFDPMISGGPSPNIERSTSLEGGCSISVKSLPQEITEEFLLDTFAHFGQIIGHKLNFTITGAHAFIDYADASSGFKACRQNIFIENQQLQVRIKRMGAKKLIQPQQQ